MIFVCRIVDAAGRRTVLRRESPHEEAVVRDLNQEGYFILSVKPASEEREGAAARLKPPVVLEFTQILATLTANGLAIKEALTIAKRLGGKAVAPLLADVEGRVAKGSSLFDALSVWSGSFSPLYLGLVRIGEKTGDLSSIFQQLVGYLAGRQTLRDKTVNSLVYPAFVLGIALVGGILLLTIVLPGLTGMVSSLNPQAAAVYRSNVGQFQVVGGVVLAVLAVLIAGIAVAFRRRHDDPAWALRIDAVLLRVPLLGAFTRASFGFNFAFAMETLLSTGYPLEEALQESSWVVANRRYRQGILRARDGVIKGIPLSEALREERVFPEVLVGWMAVGEGAQDLVRSFAQVRTFFQRDIDKLFSRFMNLVEPALIVGVGIILLVMILNFITPVFTMMGNLL
jgi:type II secretory pathway component PulF